MLQIVFPIAVAAEAMSAALSAGRRSMDWFGVCVLACVTALGGGTIRDVLIGHYPLSWVADYTLLLICCGAALFTIAIARFVHRLRWVFLVLDALGLVIFTITGFEVAIGMGLSPAIAIVSGMISGIAGGVARDILCQDVPLVFSSELYATVSLMTGGLYYLGLKVQIQHDALVFGCIVVGFALRMLAVAYKISMPKFIYDKDWD